MMIWYAFRVSHPDKAAKEIRESGFEAFCLMEAKHAAQSSHVRKASKWKVKTAIALPGHVIGRPLNGKLDLWELGKLRHVHGIIGSDGRIGKIRESSIQHWVNPKLPLYRDDQVPDIIQRRGIPAAPPVVRPGDRVRFEFAAQIIEGPVRVVNGDRLMVSLGMTLMGLDEIDVPTAMVQVA